MIGSIAFPLLHLFLSPGNAKVLPTVLAGIAKFAHLIDVGVALDIISVRSSVCVQLSSVHPSLLRPCVTWSPILASLCPLVSLACLLCTASSLALASFSMSMTPRSQLTYSPVSLGLHYPVANCSLSRCTRALPCHHRFRYFCLFSSAGSRRCGCSAIEAPGIFHRKVSLHACCCFPCCVLSSRLLHRVISFASALVCSSLHVPPHASLALLSALRALLTKYPLSQVRGM